MLANQLVGKYRYENCAVIALSDGGVMVGAQIARELHCILNVLLFEEIDLPREPIAIGGITATGSFVYNPQYSHSEIEDLESEYRGFIEQQKLVKMHEMNRLLGGNGLVSRDLLKGHNIILVSDGLRTSFSLEIAMEFLKPINIDKVIIATPLASVDVVDWMHLYADEINCLSVVEDYVDTGHYYDKQDIPDRKTIIKTIEKMILNWK
jgi:putative phosphoribosyl transferase